MNDEPVRESIQRGRCPDCQHRGFLLGPKGGAAQNIKCANEACGHLFNVTVYGWDIVLAERIT